MIHIQMDYFTNNCFLAYIGSINIQIIRTRCTQVVMTNNDSDVQVCTDIGPVWCNYRLVGKYYIFIYLVESMGILTLACMALNLMHSIFLSIVHFFPRYFAFWSSFPLLKTQSCSPTCNGCQSTCHFWRRAAASAGCFVSLSSGPLALCHFLFHQAERNSKVCLIRLVSNFSRKC